MEVNTNGETDRPFRSLQTPLPTPLPNSLQNGDIEDPLLGNWVEPPLQARMRTPIEAPPLSVEEREDNTIARHHGLVVEWRQILSDYDDFSKHEKFVMNCERLGAMAFAARKYQGILAVAPTEEIALRMIERIAGTMLQKFEVSGARRTKSYRIPMLNGVGIVLSSLVLAVGIGTHTAEMIWVGSFCLTATLLLSWFANAGT